ncbi:hypothetical protein OBBRIDRAFT_799699 [Obba rivulosa]|uniref:Uncharacterized protein n=1 Tax=Obba rivulosa TaxID=1052685 RepID=A0A8E2DE50_9APHY|nr:hypothetical protein OBBRIDRAFT_799699 [Obba rivulosa]
MVKVPNHVCTKQDNVGERGRPKGVLNGQGKNSAKKKKGVGLAKHDERKKTQEEIKAAALERKQR